MPLLGSHVLLICHDFPEEADRDFNEWYVREHLPERVYLPGFHRARRYRTAGEGLKYMAFYETDGNAMSSEPYLKLVRDFDPRSRQFVPRFISAARTVSLVRSSSGIGEGGVVGLISFETDAKTATALRQGNGTQLADIQKRYGVTGVHLLEADEAALSHSRHGHLRQNDLILPWTLLIEAIDDDALSAVWRDLTAPAGLSALGAGKVLLQGRYRMLFGLTDIKTPG